MSRTRSSPKAVRTECGRLLGLFQDCLRYRWTLETYTAQRGSMRVAKGATHADIAEIWGYRRALWDAVWAQLVWRLGPEQGPMPEGLPWDYRRGNPTHGAFYWRGTEDPFTAWEPLSRTPAPTDERLPPCAASMGCLCAGHARGNDADAACDTSE